MPSIANLAVSLTARTGGFTRGLRAARAELSGFRAYALTGFAGVAAGAAAATVGLIRGVSESADAMGKLAQRVGVGVEAMSGLLYAANRADVSTQQLEAGLRRLSANAYAASQGVGSARDAFDAVGVTVTTSGGSLKSTDQVLKELADRFAVMPDGIQKTALMMQLFGKSGAELIPLMNEGGAAISQAQQNAREMGIVFTDQASAAADTLNDSVGDLGSMIKGVGNQAVSPLLPVLADMTAKFAQATESSGSLTLAAGLLSGALKTVVSSGILIKNTFEIIGDVVRASLEAMAGLMAGDSVTAAWAVFKHVLGEVKTDVNDITKGMEDVWKGIPEGRRAVTISAGAAGSLGNVSDSGEDRSLERARDSIARQVGELELEALTFGMSATQVELYKLELQGATQAQLLQAEGALQTVDALKQQQSAMEEAKRVIEQTRTPTERFASELERLKGLRLDNLLDADTFKRAVVQAYQEARATLGAGRDIADLGEFRQIDLRRTAIGGAVFGGSHGRGQQRVEDPALHALVRELIGTIKKKGQGPALAV